MEKVINSSAKSGVEPLFADYFLKFKVISFPSNEGKRE